MALSFDTTFLIDLYREMSRGVDGRATRFLKVHAEHELHMSVVVLGEFAAGFDELESPLLQESMRRFVIHPIDVPVADVYREIFRSLKGTGRLIGANDLWIAATSIKANLPLVTRNAREFLRVPSLDVKAY
jgi:predicted nucleic acid-binding protein